MAKKADRDDDDKPRSDAYVGLLGITLAAVIGGAVLMFLDHSAIDESAKTVQPPAVNLAPDGLEYKQAPKQ
jgi:hypothetical protein